MASLASDCVIEDLVAEYLSELEQWAGRFKRHLNKRGSHITKGTPETVVESVATSKNDPILSFGRPSDNNDQSEDGCMFVRVSSNASSKSQKDSSTCIEPPETNTIDVGNPAENPPAMKICFPSESSESSAPESSSSPEPVNGSLEPASLEPTNELKFALNTTWKDKDEGVRRMSVANYTTNRTVSVLGITESQLLECQRLAEKNRSLWIRIYAASISLPGSLRRVCWEVIISALLIYEWFAIPLLALRTYDAGDVFVNSLGFVMLSSFVKVLWLVDIMVSFTTSYHANDGTLIVNPEVLFKRYVRSRFVPDVIVACFDWAGLAYLGATRGGTAQIIILVLSNTFRFLRLLVRSRRLKKDHIISDFCHQRMSQSRTLLVTIFKYISVMICATHVFACVWYLVGSFDLDGEGWVKQMSVYDEPLNVRYIYALHFATSLYTNSVDPSPPANVLERYAQTFLLFTAFVTSTLVVSSITTAMTQLHIMAAKRTMQFAALTAYLSDNNISRELATKVQRNARFALAERNRLSAESSIELLSLLSEPLRIELNFQVNSDRLFRHPFFCHFNTQDHTGCKKICHLALTRSMILTGESLFEEDEEAEKMYFVIRGSMIYSQKSVGAENEIIGTEHWVAEAALWTKWRHFGELRACSDTLLLALDADKFQRLAGKSACVEVRLYARLFVENLQATEISDLTDISGTNDPDLICILDEAFPDLRKTGRKHRSSLEKHRNTFNATVQKSKFTGISATLTLAKRGRGSSAKALAKPPDSGAQNFTMLNGRRRASGAARAMLAPPEEKSGTISSRAKKMFGKKQVSVMELTLADIPEQSEEN